MNNQGGLVKKKSDLILKHTCPWWFLFTFDNPLRRLYQDPAMILAPHLAEGDRVLDLGCGMGFLTLPAAAMVGENGRVVAVDLQTNMLDGLWRKAGKSDLESRIQLQLADQGSIGVSGPFDLALAFWMVHEVHDRNSFLAQIRDVLRPGGKLLIAEPYLHVSRVRFLEIKSEVEGSGLRILSFPKIGFSRSLLAVKEN